MTKKKQPKKPLPPFAVEGMTVDQIINLGDDVISKMNQRDLSRALRTATLAANKRLNRLLKKAEVTTNEMGDVKYTDISGQGLDFEALYATGGKKFGLGKGKHQRSEIYKEFAKVRNFLNAGSTTISGAIELRKKRERQLFGNTREELYGKLPPAEAALMETEMKDIMSDIYSEFHRWKEEYQIEGGYNKELGKRVLKMFGRRTMKGMSAEDARAEIEDYYDKKYETQEKKRLGYENE